MTVFKIRSKVLREERHKVESTNGDYIARRLTEIKQRDPLAKIIRLEVRG